MHRFSPSRPYLSKWLKRCARELSGSGRKSQIARRLANDLGGSEDDWERRLNRILNGEEQPSSELVTHLDRVWSSHQSPAPGDDGQGSLF